MPSRRHASAAVLTVVAMAALATVLAKGVLGPVAPFTFVWLQVPIGAVLLTGWTFGICRHPWPRGLRWSTWLAIAWVGGAQFALVRLAFMWSLERLEATTHAFGVQWTGFATMAISAVLLREPPTRWQVAGAGIALLGLWVYVGDVPPPAERVGLLVLLLGVVLLAATNNALRWLGRPSGDRLPGVVVATLAMWIGGVPMTVTGLLSDWPPEIRGPWPWAVLSLNAGAAAVGTAVFASAMRSLRSYEASMLAATGVVFAGCMAGPILGEWLGWADWLGIALLLAGIALAQRRGSIS